MTALSTLPALAADWSQWRGPNFNGSSPEKGLPAHWSKDKAVWSLDMAGPSASTPIILGDHLFTSTVDERDKTLHALCVDRKSGKVLWDNKTGDGIARGGDQMSNFASPSPVVDDQRAFFFYGNGTLVAFDHAGKELWNRSITKEYGDFAFQWTFSSTPCFSRTSFILRFFNAMSRSTAKESKALNLFCSRSTR